MAWSSHLSTQPTETVESTGWPVVVIVTGVLRDQTMPGQIRPTMSGEPLITGKGEVKVCCLVFKF